MCLNEAIHYIAEFTVFKLKNRHSDLEETEKGAMKTNGHGNLTTPSDKVYNKAFISFVKGFCYFHGSTIEKGYDHNGRLINILHDFFPEMPVEVIKSFVIIRFH